MQQHIGYVALIVRDYDDAIEFFTKKLDFEICADEYQSAQDKRWVVVAPPMSAGTTTPTGTKILLSRANCETQRKAIGNQSGGRVFLFLFTDDFQRDYDKLVSRGVKFVRKPRLEPFGTVAVFEDLYGNLWDLIQSNEGI